MTCKVTLQRHHDVPLQRRLFVDERPNMQVRASRLVTKGDPGARYHLTFETDDGLGVTLRLERDGFEALSDFLADFLCDTPTFDGRHDDLQQLIDFPLSCDCGGAHIPSRGGKAHLSSCASLSAGYDATPPVMF